MFSEKDFIVTNYSSLESVAFECSAPSNIALVNYWGKKENQIPANPSISFTLNNCKTITKVNFIKKDMENFKAGTYINQKYYKSFQPEKINRVWNLQNRAVSELFNEANNLLGKLDMYSEYVPNIDLFISMHVVKEATQSSKIEGTKTNIAEALLEKEDVVIEKRDDWEEVQNYIMALNTAITALEELPFSSRLIKQTHKILLQGVRGKHKLPGDFRSSQNWIGGATLSDAIFVPPVHTSVDECMSDLEKFLNNEEIYVPHLIRIGIGHYQFETIRQAQGR